MAHPTATVSIQSVPLMGPSQPQTIIVAYPKKSNRRDHFKHRHSMVIGILLIVSASLAIVLNGIGFWTNVKKITSYHSYTGGIYVFLAVWSAPFVYLAGAFAVVSAKTKRVGFIITTLIMSIVSAVFAAPVVALSSWVVAAEEILLRTKYTPYYGDLPEGLTQLRKSSLAIGVFMLLCGVVEFVSSIVLSVLCCKTVCCGNNVPESDGDTAQVVFLNSGNQMITASNPQAMAGPVFAEQGITSEASGSDLPPSYSTSEVNEVGLEEAGECPTKSPIPK